MKVILKGYIEVSDHDLPAVQQALPTHIEETRKESGCLVFSVTADDKVKNRFNVYEEFIDQAAFDFHQTRAKNSIWGKVSKNVARHYEINQSD